MMTPETWSRLNYGTCLGCMVRKFIGHGPLCTDCSLSRTLGIDEDEPPAQEVPC